VRQTAVGLAVIGVLLIAGMLLYIYTGRFNVAATQEHSDLTEWILETTKDASVRYHARDIAAPDLDDSALVEEGAEHFLEDCVLCHGGPGVERSTIGRGLNPPAPDLADEVGEWRPAELFWITRHGLRMTGMPAFGVAEPDAEIWAVTAFLRRLPTLTAEEFQALTAPPPADSLPAAPEPEP